MRWAVGPAGSQDVLFILRRAGFVFALCSLSLSYARLVFIYLLARFFYFLFFYLAEGGTNYKDKYLIELVQLALSRQCKATPTVHRPPPIVCRKFEYSVMRVINRFVKTRPHRPHPRATLKLQILMLICQSSTVRSKYTLRKSYIILL